MIMPVFKHPRSLLDLSIDAMCNIVMQMLAKGVHMMERTDDAVQGVEDKMEEVFANRTIGGGESDGSSALDSMLVSEAKTTALDLFTVKQMVEKHGDFPAHFNKYITELPGSFTNEIFSRVLNNFFKIVGAHDEDQVDKFMDDKWSFPPRIRAAFRILLKCFLSSKISSFSVSRLTNKYFKLFRKNLLKSENYKNKDYMEELKEKNKDVFINTIICFKDHLSSLTDISMQNLADGELLWLICCHCPHLWYLDIRGDMFDLQRSCVFAAAAGAYVTAVDKDGVRQFQDAEFLDALCGLYGNNSKSHDDYKGTAQGCFKLRRLLLPDCIWENDEENILLDQIIKIFQQLPHLEEVTGVCLLYILCKLNDTDLDYPLMLKLKKFDGKTGGHRLIGIDPKRLRKVKLPLVTEVNFSLNVFMKALSLEIFPNMRHLKVTPYDTRGYTLETIMPYLKQLVSLDIEFFNEISLSNMCDIASNCKVLKSLSMTCLALNLNGDVLSSDEVKAKEQKRAIEPPYLRLDKQEIHEYEPVESSSVFDLLSDYPKKLSNIRAAPYENEDSTTPDFSNLRTLQFFDLAHVDNTALFKCVKGSPALQTFTVTVNSVGGESKEHLDDDFIGRIAPLLRWVREITFAIEREDISDTSKLKLTGISVAHLLHFCQDICAISRVVDWDITLDVVKGLNYYFKNNNYVLRLH